MEQKAQGFEWTVALAVFVSLMVGVAGAAQDAPPGEKDPNESKPDPVPVTKQDKEIFKRTKNRKYLREAQSWNRARIAPHTDIELMSSDAYDSGAVRVWADLEGGKKFRPAKFYIEMPDDPEVRKKLITRVTDTCASVSLPAPDPLTDEKQRYLVINLLAALEKK